MCTSSSNWLILINLNFGSFNLWQHSANWSSARPHYCVFVWKRSPFNAFSYIAHTEITETADKTEAFLKSRESFTADSTHYDLPGP